MSREQKKAAAEARKKIREANKEKYGYATLNGERVEIGYTAEPSSIFMGRGKHPLRGRWKRGARYKDIILNLSPDAPTPTPPGGGHWKERVFDPEGLWVAKWQDKLSGELKYIWLADTVRHKQEREIEKFDRARELEELIGKVRQHIEKNLGSEDIKRRKVATVCWLIDNVKMRVGDEKDKDEADTCIPVGEPVLGEECKPIQTYKVGDLILDGQGQLAPIIKLFKKSYLGHVIKIHGHGLFPFILTSDHPVLVAQRIGETGDTFDFTAPKFKSAKELVCGQDYLVFPKFNSNIQNYKIDLTRHPMLIKRPGPQQIPLDEKLAEFLGLYLAEGCAILERFEKNRHEGRIVLTFGLREIDLAKRAASLASNLFHRKVRVFKEGSRIRVIFFSLQLARFLRQHFGKKAHLKVIPSFIMRAPSNITKAFVQAYFKGDACLRTEKPHGKYTYQRLVLATSSRILALQLQKLLSKIGIFAPISLKSGKLIKVILGRKIKAHQAYHVSVMGKAIEKLGFTYGARRFRPRYYDVGNYFYIPIKEIKRAPYSGDVFNFQTMNGLFEISNVAVHNCGATTLRGSHVNIDGENVNFDFLGKDSVRWVKTIKPPPKVAENLRSFIGKPQEEIFSGVRSEKVNAFLGEVMPGLTAKVFRTYHSSRAVKKFLEALDIKPEDPEFKKKYAAMMANLKAAILCHHKRKLPKNWAESLKKKEERLRALKAQLIEVRKKPKSKMRKKRIGSLTKRIEEAEVKVKAAKATRDYNLNTSLKSYIDPRHFVKWAMDVEYDWKKIYPKTLQQKFTWAEETSNQ
jgi:DNA topoisomerase IB